MEVLGNELVLSLNDFIDSTIFSEITKFERVFIYDTDDTAKIITIALLNRKINIAGYVVSRKKYDEISGIRYINKPVYCEEDTSFSDEDDVIITAPGKHPKTRSRISVKNLFINPGLGSEVLIYGAGGIGERLLNILSSMGIATRCFVDNNPRKQGDFLGGGGDCFTGGCKKA